MLLFRSHNKQTLKLSCFVNPCFFHSIHYSYPFKKSVDFRLYYYRSKKRRALTLNPCVLSFKNRCYFFSLFSLNPFQFSKKCGIIYVRHSLILRFKFAFGKNVGFACHILNRCELCSNRSETSFFGAWFRLRPFFTKVKGEIQNGISKIFFCGYGC